MKIPLFEYFLLQLVHWSCDFYQIRIADFNEHPKNDLSKLKVFKLHFFACSTDEAALDIFSFKALPYGHVESEVYSKLDELQYCRVTNKKLEIIDICGFQDQEPELSELIDQIVENLRKENNDLISYDPFELVDLSHRWFSWRYTYKMAREEKTFSKPIFKKLIAREEKYYSLP